MTPDLEKLRAACRDNCAYYGDPPCFDLDDDPTSKGRDFCRECHEAAGISFNEPSEFDPEAAVRPLL